MSDWFAEGCVCGRCDAACPYRGFYPCCGMCMAGTPNFPEDYDATLEWARISAVLKAKGEL